jgi:hypothetical protein
MAITIRVPWGNPYNKDHQWNELLAWTVETFGLPGECMQFHPTADFMDFVFDNEQDALVFQLKTGGIRRSNEEITVDFIGQYI